MDPSVALEAGIQWNCISIQGLFDLEYFNLGYPVLILPDIKLWDLI